VNKNFSSPAICDSCVHFHEQAYYHEKDKGHGRCHRYPPNFTESSSGDKIHHWQFPLVYLDSWCGEHVLIDAAIKTAVKNQ